MPCLLLPSAAVAATLRIAALTPHLVEQLYAAGAGERLVAAVDFSDYPPEARRLPSLGQSGRVDLEALVALQPDLVVGWSSGNSPQQLAQIEALGIRVYRSEPRSLAEIADELEALGRLAGTEATANAAAARYREGLARLREAHAGRRSLRVFYQIWDQPLMTVNGAHMISDALALCGAVNLFAELPELVPRISSEAVLAADPDAIVIGVPAAQADTWRAAWLVHADLRAVRDRAVVTVNPDLLHRATTRALDGVAELCGGLEAVRDRDGG
ncbi:MAG TPA: cobalamin-binding protein [Gammaproteobacteria bacterium]